MTDNSNKQTNYFPNDLLKEILIHLTVTERFSLRVLSKSILDLIDTTPNFWRNFDCRLFDYDHIETLLDRYGDFIHECKSCHDCDLLPKLKNVRILSGGFEFFMESWLEFIKGNDHLVEVSFMETFDDEEDVYGPLFEKFGAQLVRFCIEQDDSDIESTMLSLNKLAESTCGKLEYFVVNSVMELDVDSVCEIVSKSPKLKVFSTSFTTRGMANEEDEVDGLKIVKALKDLEHIERLGLYNNALTDECLEILMESKFINKLKTVLIGHNPGLSFAAIEKFLMSVPNLEESEIENHSIEDEIYGPDKKDLSYLKVASSGEEFFHNYFRSF
eukprot:TRINITY_DN5606_c0_g1_i1.p1 TRINITY_DN5606_c0_g1~~TRINITY_DN5606_c0_g1_i1.p1  ORF type:complete len:329 (+),score=68.44 TRINITY_DN5606_c0_g1_i1:3-989(+)